MNTHFLAAKRDCGLSIESLALAVCNEYPSWSLEMVAKYMGVAPSTLYRNRKLRHRMNHRPDFRRGFKFNGIVEAVDANP